MKVEVEWIVACELCAELVLVDVYLVCFGGCCCLKKVCHCVFCLDFVSVSVILWDIGVQDVGCIKLVFCQSTNKLLDDDSFLLFLFALLLG